MRATTSVPIVTFLLVAAGAAGIRAKDNVTLKGSDTLFNVVQDVLAQCPGAAGLTFVGGGQGSGDTNEKNGVQTINPATNYPNTSTVCTASSNVVLANEELLAIGLDGFSIIGAAAQTQTSTCHGATSTNDCDPTTEPNAGLAFNKTISLSDGTTYTFNGWRDVLRVLFAGFDHNAGTDITKRNCNSLLRQTLANNWGAIFQDTCTSTTATQIRHVFRRDDTAGTTTFFLASLNLPALNTTANTDPFCNVIQSTDTLPAGVNRYPADYQDNDPIRRVATSINEQAVSRKGDLGLVIPVSSADNLSVTDAFPTTACGTNTIFGAAPQIILPNGNLTSTPGNCPNGDVSFLGGLCFVPVDNSGNPNCLASRLTTPSFVFNNTAVDGVKPSAADGRVYNQHFRVIDSSGHAAYNKDKSTPARAITGSLLRLHQTRTLDPNGTTCQKQEADHQLGCFITANPSSIGFGGHDAAVQPGAVSLKVNAVEPTTQCIQSFTYPLSRKVYVDTLIGFWNVTGQELALSRCFNNTNLVTNSLTNEGFFPFPTNGGAAFAEDYNEHQFCGAASNAVSFVHNNDTASDGQPAGLPTNGTVCGNAIREAFEDCDQGVAGDPGALPNPSGLPGTGNGALGVSDCSTSCRLNN